MSTKGKTKSKPQDQGANPNNNPGKLPQAQLTNQPHTLFNRELSWLDFNMRVLAQATFDDVPLLERIRFLSIFSMNLDEFFMVRVAGLKEQLRAALRDRSQDGVDASELLDRISTKVREMIDMQWHIWHDKLLPELETHNVCVVRPEELTKPEKKFLRKYYLSQIFPVLTPMAVDPAHPFPHLANRSLILIVQLKNKQRGRNSPEMLNAFVEVPQALQRYVQLGKARKQLRLILIEDVISMHLSHLFAGATILASYSLRLTRDSDLEIDEEEVEDLLKVIEAELRERQWGNVVRMEISDEAPEDVLRLLMGELDIERRDVFRKKCPLAFGDLATIAKLPLGASLSYPPFSPVLQPDWRALGGVFHALREGDRMAYHPYDSFQSVAEFVDAAATDPDVLAIKMTLYRTSSDSPIIRSLIKAANNGKQVVALLELRARFDEANNIQWARMLEREGAHVVYGIVGLKTHCKSCLVVRREGNQLRRYVHVSTGNYNPQTAMLYTDVALFSADPGLCEDMANLFNKLTGFAKLEQWNKLVIAPDFMQAKLLELISQQIAAVKKGEKGRIICKMNSLVDPTVIQALYDASSAGVKIDLIVRGICCLRPKAPGLSENIRVISLVGRFLEHARIFFFGSTNQVAYLCSGDWMQRNFYNRIEIMVPVEDPVLRELLQKNLKLQLNDTVNAWELQESGEWIKKVPDGDALNSQVSSVSR